MSRVLHAVTSGQDVASASDGWLLSAQVPQSGSTTGTFVEVTRALGVAEARLDEALQGQKRLRAENARLVRSLEAASRRTATAQRIARHDGLTGLPNRLFLIERLQKAIAAASLRRRRLALLFIDLDGFKAVNDAFGHSVADRLLSAVGSRIAACVRNDDIACRYGGDEFVALLTNLGDTSVPIGVSQKIRERIAESFTIAGHEIRITASIGLAVYPDEGDRWGALLSRADAAMYRDKAARRSR
jgi:diguanylate cyclase (GGDEF)-like protein